MSFSLDRLKSLTLNYPIPDAPLPMPASLFYLSCTSIFFTITIFIASCLDYGVLSLWVTPPSCVITLIYHITVFILSRRPRDGENPTYFSTVTVCAYIIASIWCIALITTIVVLAANRGDFTPEFLHSHYHLHVSKHTQRLQCVFIIFEMFTMGGLGVKAHMIASEEGDPETWRPFPDTRENSIMPIQSSTLNYY